MRDWSEEICRLLLDPDTGMTVLKDGRAFGWPLPPNVPMGEWHVDFGYNPHRGTFGIYLMQTDERTMESVRLDPHEPDFIHRANATINKYLLRLNDQ